MEDDIVKILNVIYMVLGIKHLEMYKGISYHAAAVSIFLGG